MAMQQLSTIELDDASRFSPAPVDALKFGRRDGFHAELRRRVDRYFEETGKSPRDCPRMYLKTAW